MSKSLDNYIAITDTPSDMYGKIMSIPDSAIPDYFELCTFTPTDDVMEIEKNLKKGSGNPRDIKMRLAREITAIYHGEAKAKESEEYFVKTFQKREVPEEMKEVAVEKDTALSDILIAHGLAESKSDFRRLVSEGAVKKISTSDAEEKIMDPAFKLSESVAIKVGKHRFIRISLQ